MTLHQAGRAVHTNGPISADQRFRKDHRCPICNGAEDDRRGQGTRCIGFLSEDGEWAHCSREDHAGRAPLNARSQTYGHRLKGPCPCGTEHAPGDPEPARKGKRRGTIETTYRYVDADGRLLFEAVRFKGPKGFSQRRPDGKGGWIWDLKGVHRVLYRLPELLRADLSEPVLIPEGEKDVERLRSIGFVTTTNPMGAGKWRDEFAEPLAGRSVFIVPDNDQVGRDHAERVAASVARVAASVKVVKLPELPDHGDVSDWLDRGKTADDLWALMLEAPAWEPSPETGENNGRHRPPPRPGAPPPDDGKPTIIIESDTPGDGLGKWTGQALDALRIANKPPTLFQRARVLARIRSDDPDGPVEVETLTSDALRGVLDRSAHWGEPRVNKKGKVFIKWGPPRMEVVRDFAALPGWDLETIPLLETIVESPRFLTDGRLITTPGYHPEARIYYHPAPGLQGIEVPSSPRADDVESAKALLDEMLVDFPFADEASRANTLAVMLLPFVRMMIAGPTPLHLFEASTPGTGKGLLAKLCAVPSLGRTLGSTPQKEDEAEWRKAITTALMSGATHIFIDNMYLPVRWSRDGEYPVPIDSGTLASALTEAEWQDRILCTNTEARPKIRVVWMASGNNLEWSRELARRIVSIKLSPWSEKPWERTNFRHPEVLRWALDLRAELLRACLTICQNWVAHGQPPGDRTMGSYESYSRVMGGILDAAHVQGFLGNEVKPTDADPESSVWPALVEAWFRIKRSALVSTADLWGIIVADEELHQLLIDVLGEGSPISQKKRLGKALARHADRVWSMLRIVRSMNTTADKSALYRLEPMEGRVVPEEGPDDRPPF